MRARSAGCALVALCAWALLPGAPGEGAGRRERLDSGLTVIVNDNGAAPLVAVSLFVRVGARWETDAEAGITYLLQQLLLKGTTRRSALEIAVAAEDIGGGIGVSSDADYAEIKGTALGRHWRPLLDLVADVALRPSLPGAELEAERRPALRALRNRQDQPYPLAVDTLMARLYGGHPYGRPPQGRAEALARLTVADLRAHHERYYRAGRMVLSVSGDVRGDLVVQEAARLFADAARGDGARDAAPAGPAEPGGPTRVERPSAQTQILLGVLAPPVADPDYAAMKVLATALGGGMGGRLFAELRDRQGLAYSTGALYPSRVGPSYLLAQIGTAPDNAARAEAGMRQEIERIRAEGISDQELDRARTYLLGQFALDRRTNARLAWYAAFFESAGVGYDFPRRYVAAVQAVTVGDVRRVAQAYLAAPVMISVGPASR